MEIPYIPLTPSLKEIRLLHIDPVDDQNAPLKAKLFHAPLDNARYSALSYAWGNQDDNRVDIEIQYDLKVASGNALPVHTIWTTVGENLGSALRTLRHGIGLTIWADAICINQSDNGEKSEQVQLMFSIYEKAEKVIVWLGPSGPNTNSGIDLITEIGTDFDDLSLSDTLAPENRLEWKPQSVELGDVLKSILNGKRLTDDAGKSTQPFAKKCVSIIVAAFSDFSLLEGICDICSRPYWKRSWVIQEYLAARNLQIRCGDQAILTHHFWLFIQSFTAIMTTFEQFIESKDQRDAIASIIPKCRDLAAMLSLEATFEGSFHDLSLRLTSLYVPQRADASDPRDRIYAHLGSVEDSLGLLPDYGKSTEMVFTETAIALLMDGNVNLLNHSYSRNAELALNLPSWAIDWTAKFENFLFYESNMFFHAASQDHSDLSSIHVTFTPQTMQDPQGKEISQARMHIKGYEVGTTILTTSAAFEWTEFLDARGFQLDGMGRDVFLWHLWVKDVVKSLDEIFQDTSETEILNHLAKTLYFMKRQQFRYGMTLEEWTLTMGLLYSSPAEIFDDYARWDNVQTFQKCEMKHMNLRVVAIQDGYVGIAFAPIKVEDLVVVFSGVDYPFVIRAVGTGLFRLIGPVFIPVLMRGELFASPRNPIAQVFTLI